ncbi:MAG: hypothetical protein UHX00_01285 [Caryophanon sp.]|nr:hypothetical protein [Caryophanon sp.]
MTVKRISSFDFGTIEVLEHTVIIQLSRQHFKNMKQVPLLTTYVHDDVLPVINQTVNDYYIMLTYKKDHRLKPLMDIQKEQQLVKLSIAKTIVEQAMTTQLEGEVSLHPNTIFYFPMNTVKYTYVAERKTMPYEDGYTDFMRYRALVLSILTGRNYKHCFQLSTLQLSQQFALVRDIYRATTLAEMEQLLANATNFVTYEYVAQQQHTQRKTKRRFLLAMAAFSIIMGGIVYGIDKQAEQQTQQAVFAKEQQYEKTEITERAEYLFQQQEYEEAIQLFQQIGESDANLFQRLIDVKQYNLALELMPKRLEDVLQHIYAYGTPEHLLALTLATSNSTLTTKLELEKAIVNEYDEKLQAMLPFTNDKNTLARAADMYLKRLDVLAAEQIFQRTQDETIRWKIDDKKKRIAIRDLKKELKKLQQSSIENKTQLIATQQAALQTLEQQLTRNDTSQLAR